jgi:hypothetical protein
MPPAIITPLIKMPPFTDAATPITYFHFSFSAGVG